MKRTELDKMQVGDCLAKKCKYKTMIYRIKQMGQDYYWSTEDCHDDASGHPSAGAKYLK